LRAALVGYGPAGAGLHAPLIARTEGMEVAAVVTSDPGRREAVARDHPGAAVLDSAEAVWQDPGRFDLLVVAAPNRAHADLAERSLSEGLPVVVDKPLAVTSADADRLVALSDETGVPLAVFQNRRLDSDFLAVRELAPTIGPLVRFEARWERWRPDVEGERWRESDADADGGGLLWDLGSHLIDQALVLFGAPATVFARLACVRVGARVDDDTFVQLGFASGPDVQLWMSLVAVDPGPRFRVTGLGGLIESHGLDPQESRLRGDQAPEVALRLVTPAEGARAVPAPAADWADFYAGVRDALAAGGPMPVTGREAAEVVRVIEAARRSATSGEVVAL
jgi:predicted dehydrogenase